MFTVWVLVAFLGNVPIVIDNIASQEACEQLASQMLGSPAFPKQHLPGCFSVQKTR